MNLRKLFVSDVIFVFVLGSLLHFTYELSDNNPLVGIFSAINESTLEHTKLLLYPTIIWYILSYMAFKKKLNRFRWFTGGLLQLIVSIILIPLIFNTYTLFISHNVIIDILIFLIAIIIGAYVSYKYYISSNKYYLKDNALIFLYSLILYFYFIMTIKK